jgi:hypothetical protein
MNMNKIIREHYPASKLPDDLREGIDPSGHVTVTVVEEQQPPSRKELVRLLELSRRRSRSAGDVSSEEAVRRIRDLRDEWND